jgi:hypothetical protein
MKVGKIGKIEALLVATTDPEKRDEIIKRYVEETETAGFENIRMSSFMKVRLIALEPRDFKIEPLHSREVQPVGSITPTSWSWRVTPLRAGRKELLLIATAMIEITDDLTIESALPDQTIEIEVQINPTYTMLHAIRSYWWLLDVVILLIGLISFYRKYGIHLLEQMLSRTPVNVTEIGIPPATYKHLLTVLSNCGPFATDHEMRAMFVDNRISNWRDDIPQANSPSSRVRIVIEFLIDREDADDTNALVLFLCVLRENVSPEDACYEDLNTLIEEMESALS